jgi:hypothetical protein
MARRIAGPMLQIQVLGPCALLLGLVRTRGEPTPCPRRAHLFTADGRRGPQVGRADARDGRAAQGRTGRLGVACFRERCASPRQSGRRLRGSSKALATRQRVRRMLVAQRASECSMRAAARCAAARLGTDVVGLMSGRGSSAQRATAGDRRASRHRQDRVARSGEIPGPGVRNGYRR